MTIRRVRALLLLGSLGACAGPQAPFLRLQVQALREGAPSQSSVSTGALLRSGDRFALRAQMQRPGYLYVVQQDPAGQRRALWPQTEATLPAPAQAMTVPSEGGWFRLDEHPGEEILFAVAAPRPLSAAEVEQEITARLKQVGAREVPPRKDKNQRGDADEQSAPLNQRGVAVTWLRFVHK